MSKPHYWSRARSLRVGLSYLLLLLLLMGCGSLLGGGGPTISEFRASPTSVEAGDNVMLTWEVDGLLDGNLTLKAIDDASGNSVLLGDVTNRADMLVQPQFATTYRLSANSPEGSSSRDARVTVYTDDDSAGGGAGTGDEGGEPSDDEDEPEEQPAPNIDTFSASDDQVNDGDNVELNWHTEAAQRVTLDPPGVNVEPSGSIVVRPFRTTTYVLSASNGTGTSTASVTVRVDDGGSGSDKRILLVIAGQSNASGSGKEQGGDFPTSETEQPSDSVNLFKNGRWVVAEEPTHVNGKHSFGVSMGKAISEATGADVFLVPAAGSGSSLVEWEDGDSLYENAVNQARKASESLGGVPVSAVVWFQGESETSYAYERNAFISDTDSVFQRFRNDMPGSPDIIFAQLSKRLVHPDEDTVPGHNLSYQDIREKQRLMEAGAVQLDVGSANPPGSGNDRSHYFMVVTHDLPHSDDKHVSAEGQRILGKRIANTFMTRVWDGPSSGAFGPGPRLESITFANGRTRIIVDTTQPLNSSSNYGGYFTVFRSVSDATPINPSSIQRDPNDSSRIFLDFSSAVPQSAYVRYMPPENTSLYTGTFAAAHRNLGGLRLPLPAFGLPVEPLDNHYPGIRLP